MSFTDNSDNQIQTLHSLPDVYRSDINLTLSDVVLDRFFTKDNTNRIIGYVGIKLNSISQSNQIQERTPHRQAFQLAPTMYTKFGTTETTLSFKSFQTKLSMLGVDMDRMDRWANATEFTWVPPVNLDMLINYQNYFWLSDTNNKAPQYLTIENICNKSKYSVNAYDNILKQRGIQFVINDISFATSSFIVSGDVVSVFSIDNVFYTKLDGNINLDDKTWNIVSLVYDNVNDITTITTSNIVYSSVVPPVNPLVGQWWYNATTNTLSEWTSTTWIIVQPSKYVNTTISAPAVFPLLSANFTTNSFDLVGKMDDVFTDKFVFVIQGAGTYLSDNTWTALSSDYNIQTNITTTTVLEQIAYVGPIGPTHQVVGYTTAPIVGYLWFNSNSSILSGWDGMEWITIDPSVAGTTITITDLLITYRANSLIACDSVVGLSAHGWDNTNSSWNADLLKQITHTTIQGWLLHNKLEPLALWYNPTTDELYQYGDVNNLDPSDPNYKLSWIPITANFSTVIQQSIGTSNLDNYSANIQLYNQWSTSNKWIHKSSINSFNSITRAQLPILEYDSRVELNEWIKVERTWKYRAHITDTFEVVDTIPNKLELEPIKNYTASQIGSSWYLFLYEFEPSILSDDSVFRIVDSLGGNHVYIVDGSDYRLLESTDPVYLGQDKMVVVVKLKGSVFSSALTSVGSNTHVEIIPAITSRGDAWMGYHQHWCLIEEYTNTVPTSPQKLNTLAELDNLPTSNTATTINIKTDTTFSGFVPQVSSVITGLQYQELVIDIAGVTRIDLLPKFTYPNAITSIANSGNIRVYVNGIRQYGSYSETINQHTIGYTRVDSSTLGAQYVPNIPANCVVGILFNVGFLKLGDVVKICVGSAAYSGMGLTFVPVRTVEKDTLFAAAVSNQTQPIYMSLTPYNLAEQQKIDNNQYPLFDIYDIITNDVVDASPIFSFKEASTSDINNNINKRIIQLDNGTNYIFQQHLSDIDNGILLGYRNRYAAQKGTFWYNPTQNVIQHWDGLAWSSMVTVVDLVTGNASVLPIIVSINDPTQIKSQRANAMWYNSATNVLYKMDPISSTWILLSTPIVNVSDPTLQTIWQPNLNQHQYIPKYVDSLGSVVSTNSVDGDWEVINQWKYNPEHSNKLEISLVELYSHCNSIVSNQKKLAGLSAGGVYSYTQSAYDYSVGGTIKEYNDSFDTLISAMNVSNITPIGLIEHAEQEYTSAMQSLFKLFMDNLSTIVTNSTKKGIFDFNAYVASSVINLYETNDANAKIYGDSSAYDNQKQIGIKNWIASPSILGLLESYKPNLSMDSDGIVYIQHHDGHRSLIRYTVANVDTFSRRLSRVKYPNTNYSMCNVNSKQPPSKLSDYVGLYGNLLLPGLCWYVIGNATSFYRLELYESSPTPPILLGSIPNGTKYYNTTESNTYVVNNGNWVLVSSGIGALWKEINFAELAGNIYLEVENRLYDVAKDVTLKFDYNNIVVDDSDINVYNQKRSNRFDSYVAVNNIVSPYANYQFSQTNPWTWNYQYSILNTTPPTTLTIPNIVQTSSWQSLYNTWYNTPYPQLEPWKLQGYINKPNWWDIEYLDTSGTRRWKYNHLSGIGMWKNIMLGNIPSGRLYPSGIISTGNSVIDKQIIPTYNYFSVNIGDVAIQSYPPDALLPPYFDNSSLSSTDKLVISSLISVYTNIINPDADYSFGSIGPNEWNWITSTTYQYDKMIIAFMMQPSKWLHASFGTDFTVVSGLDVGVVQKQVPSHIRALFHGDIYNTNTVYHSRGLNQWYINYNRYTGYDSNTDFRHGWANWSPKLTYQFDNIVDSNSLYVSSTNIEILTQDYNTILVNTGKLSDVWLDAFNIKLVYIPPHTTSYNNEHLWKFDISVLNNAPRTIEYYGVKSYPFVVNTTTNICTTTSIILPWTLGDIVVFNSSSSLPFPLVSNTPYFIIRDVTTGISDFKLAETYNEALLGINIDITTTGSGIVYVSEVNNSFTALGGASSSDVWYHIAIDKSVKNTINVPSTITGLQNLINIIDGISEVYTENGFVLDSADTSNFDPITGRLITWQLEVERFIEWAYGIRSFANQVNDRYNCVVNTSDNTMTITDTVPMWSGNQQVVFTSTGLLPIPLYQKVPYYIFPTSVVGVYHISVSNNTLDLASMLDITTSGTGQLMVSQYSKSNKFATFELNPHRDAILLSTPTGILSDVINGPQADTKVGQTIFDQYGRSLNSSELLIYRNDNRCSINIMPQLTNDVDIYYANDPYHYIHIGGCHLFVESYEHMVLFEHYTIGNQLIYDPFLGISTNRLNLDFQSSVNRVMRPNMGGYYLYDNQFKRNIEGAAYDLNTCYDVFSSFEDSDMIQRSRGLLGYEGNLSFLNTINVNPKSQFMFYRGMVATKGSTTAISAYVKSRHFVNSTVDEFWAYKASSFGDVRPKVYPEVKILPTDVIIDDIRLEFVGATDSINSSEVTSADKQGFINVLTTDKSRWNNYPDQETVITGSLFLDAELTQITSIFINNYPPSGDQSTSITYWYNNTNLTLYSWSGTDWSTVVYDKVKTTADYVYIKNDTTCDDVRAIRNELQKNILSLDIIRVDTHKISLLGSFIGTLYAGMIIDIIDPDKKVISHTIVSVDYMVSTDTTVVTLNDVISPMVVNGQLQVFIYDFSSYTTVFLSPLPDGESAYYNINGECVRFPTTSFTQLIYIYNVNPSKHRISPAKLIDTTSGIVVENIPLWHPAIGYHYYVAEHNIHLQSYTDPAKYSNTPSSTNISNSAWNIQEVNKVWLDTSYLGYIPYSDATIYPLIGDRLSKWGKLSEFGSVQTYIWTKSSVLPENWGALVTTQSTDNTILQNNKATGIAKPSLFTTTRTLLTGTVNLLTSDITITNGTVNQNDPIIFSILGNTPTGIDQTLKYLVSTPGNNLTTFALSDLVGNTITYEQGSVLIHLMPMVVGVISSQYTVYDNYFKYVLQADIGVVSNGDIITFSTSGTLPIGLNYYTHYTVINVVINSDNTTITFDVIDPLVSLLKPITIAPQTIDSVATVNTGSTVYYYPAGKGELYITIVSQQVLLAPAFDRSNLVKRPFVRIHMPIPLLVYEVPNILINPEEYCDLTYCDDTYIATLETTLDTVTSIIFPITNPLLVWNATAGGVTWYNNENVDIYVNGTYVFSSTIVMSGNNCTVRVISGSYTFNESDIVDIVRSYRGIDLSFDPTTVDDGSVTTWWVEDYEYTTITTTNPNGVNITSYYFWVSQSTNILPGYNKLSTATIASGLLNNPSAYFVVQRPLDSVIIDSSAYGWDSPPYDDILAPAQYDQNGNIISPIRTKFGWSCGTNLVNDYSELFVIAYREAIIRNLSQPITSSNRYAIRFTRDLTLRDDIQANSQNMNLKNIHDEWILFRKNQTNNLPRYLWDKLTESLAGITLVGGAVVPSIDRVVYDSQYGTNTRYGLGVGQSFVNKQLGISTVLHYLNDPLSDFAPINIEDFMSTYKFDTPTNIISTMNIIYNTFNYTNVNNIWFAVLYDALSTNYEYKDLMKTSWISLNSLQHLDVNGKFSQQ